MIRATLSERALVLAPVGLDAAIASALLSEGGLESLVCSSLLALIEELDHGAAFALITEEALQSGDIAPLVRWLGNQQEWSDFPFILLTNRGGGLERNPAAGRHLELLGNVTFLERPFHPTTLLSLAQSALRARRRQYEARSRLVALRESEARYATLFETMDEGFCVIRFIDGAHGPLSDYVHVQMNAAYERHTGIDNAIGRRVRELVPDEADGWIELYRDVLQTGKPIRFERELLATRRHLELSAFRIEPAARNEVAVLFQDVTARTRAQTALRELNETLERRVEDAVAERQIADEKLHQAQKLETIGQLTGGVAHDFNNLLTPITGALDLLWHRYGDQDPRMKRLINGALESAERARVLVSRLLGFARRQALETKPIDLTALLLGMQDLIRSSIGPAIRLEIDCPLDTPAVLADASQLELAILNLCVNARDAMPDGGRLEIVTNTASLTDLPTRDIPSGDYVCISLRDTGAGMDAETLSRAIEPFYTTKGTGKGTGLGLSMVHGLAAQLGGSLSLSSKLGAGTQADLILPVARETATFSEPLIRSQHNLPEMRALNILLIDDEDVVRFGTAEMLREIGHHVRDVATATQALSELEAGLQVDMMITDYMMPGMNGASLAERASQLKPELPVLIVTGYAGGELELGLPQLNKPFRHADLAQAIFKALA
ncbi:ATP-binding protein [Blastomonas aquatica]|uniref:histidine kinase n=1 Tax=Blastomonas aquatica TaxID=1510276 RepID=A0ABQ1JCX3_9SPHN|nr:ATP-binding protein [Blastomonas aquatica]GGB65665.1 hypothetical protein GCM10010833_21050 [Blastomonas aquatica]